jgi:hypothetical protein
MAAKTSGKKQSSTRTGLPPGIKRSTLKTSAALRKMIREDRGIASGGVNIVHRQKAPAVAR